MIEFCCCVCQRIKTENTCSLSNSDRVIIRICASCIDKDNNKEEMTHQSRLGSFIEVGVNTLIGFFLAMGVQAFVFPLYGITVSHSTNFQMTFIFTIVSMILSYSIRRWFNGSIGRSIINSLK